MHLFVFFFSLNKNKYGGALKLRPYPAAICLRNQALCSHLSHWALVKSSNVSFVHLMKCKYILFINNKISLSCSSSFSLSLFKDFRKLLKKEERPILMMFYAPCESFFIITVADRLM